jgi:DNA-binding SARP family transcriptional activator
MRVVIGLLGRPSVECDGVPRPAPRGRKPWALLAYLALTGRPHSREHLAGLLCAHADDPLAALRWNVAELRRLLGEPTAFRGRETSLALPPGTLLDVQVLMTASWREAVQLPCLGLDLLETMTFPGEHALEDWLMLQRSRLRGTTATVLREAAAACLGNGDHDRAAEYAGQLLRLEPFDEHGHELLVRAHAAAGRRDDADLAVRRCIDLFRAELGIEPSRAVVEAAVPPAVRTAPSGVRGPASVRAHLDLGEAAIQAGALDTGLDSLRGAVAEAADLSDDGLSGDASFALGHALVHAVRGRDGEAAAVLHHALALAERAGRRALQGACHRELGYIEMLLAQYDRALARLHRAAELATEDADGLAWTLAYEAVCHSDTGHYDVALACLQRCLDLASAHDLPRQRAHAQCLLGRVHLLRGELGEAEVALRESLAIAEHHRWTAFVPWPEALLADVQLRAGTCGMETRERLEHASDLADRLSDPCWRGAARRGLGLVAAFDGRPDSAVAQLREAADVCVLLPDGYRWMQAYALDALCAVSVQHDDPQADLWIADLTAAAARGGMTEMLARAYLHRAHLGDPRAGATAALLAAQVDNPALDAELAAVVLPLHTLAHTTRTEDAHAR